MTELSLAAQAVAKAALYVSFCDPEEYPYQAQEIAAAALRAAADEVCLRWAEQQHPADVLNNIADELDLQ